MRLVLKTYDDGGTYCYETSDDGGDFIRDVMGKRQPGDRISTFIEVSCDETPQGADRLFQALSWLKEESAKRKAAWSSGAGLKKPVARTPRRPKNVS